MCVCVPRCESECVWVLYEIQTTVTRWFDIFRLFFSALHNLMPSKMYSAFFINDVFYSVPLACGALIAQANKTMKEWKNQCDTCDALTRWWWPCIRKQIHLSPFAKLQWTEREQHIFFRLVFWWHNDDVRCHFMISYCAPQSGGTFRNAKHFFAIQFDSFIKNNNI